MIGTVMAANVFFDIIPAHRELIRAKEAGREPDPRPGIQAKQRSVHNNYLTLPVLLTMLAGHFPFAYGADHAWLVLVALMAIGAWARLFFNLRHDGRDALVDARGRRGGVRRAGRRRRQERRPRPRPPSSASDAARGKQVFVSAGCGACHTLADAGVDGCRRPEPRRGGARPRRSSPTRVRNGQGAMPRSPGSPVDEQIAAVAAYVRRRRRRIGSRAMLTIAAGGFEFTARLEEADAPRRSPRSGGCCRSSRGSSTSAGPARPAGSPSASSTSASARRTPPAIRTRARSSSTRAASPRPRSCSHTATSTSPPRRASSPGTTSPRSSRATRTCGRWGRSSSGRARRRSCSARRRSTGGR